MKITIQKPKLADYQERILYDKARITITEASTKCGKTHSHIWWLFEQAHGDNVDNQNYWWIAPTYKQADIAFNRMKEKVIHTGLYGINLSKRHIKTPKGSCIVFLSAEDPENLYGENVYAAVMDEATRCRPEAWHALRSTLTFTKGPVKMIGNYKGSANWVHQLKNKTENDPNYAYFRINAYDAVDAGILSLEEVEDAKKSLPSNVFKNLYLAEDGDQEDQLIKNDAIKDVFFNENITGTGEKYISADIAFEGSDSFVIGLWDGLILEEIRIIDKSTGSDVYNEIKKMKVHNAVRGSNVIYDADGVGGFLSGFLKDAIPFHNGGSPVQEDGLPQEYKNLKSQCYFKLAEMINNGMISINADISYEQKGRLVEELEVIRNATYGRDGKLAVLDKKTIRQIIGRSPDITDMLMMRMLKELKSKPVVSFEW